MGRIIKPHALRGEVVVELVTDRTERLSPGARLLAAGGELTVVRSSRQGQRWIVKLDGVDDRTAAEGLRGQVLRAQPLDDPDALWVHQLIGCEVVDTAGVRLGRVIAVEANPASDLLVLDGEGLVPLRFVVERSAGRLVVEVPPGLLE